MGLSEFPHRARDLFESEVKQIVFWVHPVKNSRNHVISIATFLMRGLLHDPTKQAANGTVIQAQPGRRMLKTGFHILVTIFFSYSIIITNEKHLKYLLS